MKGGTIEPTDRWNGLQHVHLWTIVRLPSGMGLHPRFLVFSTWLEPFDPTNTSAPTLHMCLSHLANMAGRGDKALWPIDQRTLVLMAAMVEGTLQCRR
ncbi:hypothetical protein V6N13_044829 [Hibiscus sabdariffa]